MTAVLNIVFAGIAGVAILAALYFGGRAVMRRGQSTESAYNVGRLEARRSVQIDLIRALASIVLALIFLGAFGLTPRPVELLFSPTEPAVLEASPEAPDATPLPTDLPDPIVPTLTAPPVETAVPTNPPTDEPSPAPTNTPEPASNTAIVSSGVGVWLRGTPSTTGEQLEWLLDGTVLTVLDGQETADALLWRQVRTETGLTGWVAADFILISE